MDIKVLPVSGTLLFTLTKGEVYQLRVMDWKAEGGIINLWSSQSVINDHLALYPCVLWHEFAFPWCLVPVCFSLVFSSSIEVVRGCSRASFGSAFSGFAVQNWIG